NGFALSGYRRMDACQLPRLNLRCKSSFRLLHQNWICLNRHNPISGFEIVSRISAVEHADVKNCFQFRPWYQQNNSSPSSVGSHDTNMKHELRIRNVSMLSDHPLNETASSYADRGVASMLQGQGQRTASQLKSN